MNKLGEQLIKTITVVFEVVIPLTEENAKKIADAVIDVIERNDYGYCPDCEQRIPDEPMRDESRD